LVNAHILFRHGINLQTARAHALESALQMTVQQTPAADAQIFMKMNSIETGN
jgi:hypothetical protein